MAKGKQQNAVPSPRIHQLRIQKVFDGLSQNERLYAHHMSRYEMLSFVQH